MIKSFKYGRKWSNFSEKDRKISVDPHACATRHMSVIFIWNTWDCPPDFMTTCFRFTSIGQWAYWLITRLAPQKICRLHKFCQTQIICSSQNRGFDRFQWWYPQHLTFYDSQDSINFAAENMAVSWACLTRYGKF